jgi:hypothetical protein
LNHVLNHIGEDESIDWEFTRYEKNVLSFTRDKELDFELESHFMTEDGNLDPYFIQPYHF